MNIQVFRTKNKRLRCIDYQLQQNIERINLPDVYAKDKDMQWFDLAQKRIIRSGSL